VSASASDSASPAPASVRSTARQMLETPAESAGRQARQRRCVLDRAGSTSTGAEPVHRLLHEVCDLVHGAGAHARHLVRSCRIWVRLVLDLDEPSRPLSASWRVLSKVAHIRSFSSSRPGIIPSSDPASSTAFETR
jgi:hypothetical protein